VYKRALVPLDGSVVAETVIPFLLEIAGPLDMEVVLLRVNQPVAPIVIEGARSVQVEDLEARRIDAEEYLGPVAVELRAKGIRVDTRVRRGLPAEEIVAAAKEEGADLIAMSTHGRSGLGRLLFGSVAEAVLRQSDVPVFLMRASEAQVATRAAREAVRS
jgi:nucleotide-binding universal stress UspA family protein